MPRRWVPCSAGRCFTRRVTDQGVELETGELIPADTVVVSIGDAPDLDFLPGDVATERGFVLVNEDYQTSNPKVYAIGDVVRPGLLTDAIGAGRRAAETISEIIAGKRPGADRKMVIDINRISLEYLDPRIVQYEDMAQCGSQCCILRQLPGLRHMRGHVPGGRHQPEGP
jgi:NADH dehydrogenase FAD-containing subunit